MKKQKKIGLIFSLAPIWGTVITVAIMIFSFRTNEDVQISELMSQMFYANIPFYLGIILCPIGIIMLVLDRKNQQNLEQQTN